MAKEMKVQAFFNLVFNLGSPVGQSKFVWGFGVFDLSESVPLKEQLLSQIQYTDDQVFNMNLTAFTPVDTINFRETKEQQK